MIEFGKTLRMAREAKGLTPGQLAERTHMIVQTVEGLEREDFSRIVAPIYGRGFVKLYCEAVGLEPKPLVEAFMELYSGGRDARPAAAAEPAPTTSVAPAAPAAAKPPPEVQATIDFDSPAIPVAPSGQAPTRQPQQPSSRYAAPMPINDGLTLPAVNWRMVALAAAAVAIVAIAILGVRALYRVTMTAPEDGQTQEVPAPAAATPAETGAQDAANAADRKPLPLKPFYIDSDHTTEKENK